MQRELMQRRGPLLARRRHRVVEEERALRETREQWLPEDSAVFGARLQDAEQSRADEEILRKEAMPSIMQMQRLRQRGLRR